MVYLIVLLVGMLMGLITGKILYRHHYRKAKAQLEESKSAVREMMYQTHHQGINPIAKRIRGLCQLLSKLLDQAEKKFPALSPLLVEMFLLIETIEREALTLEKDVLDKVKKFEHLQ